MLRRRVRYFFLQYSKNGIFNLIQHGSLESSWSFSTLFPFLSHGKDPKKPEVTLQKKTNIGLVSPYMAMKSKFSSKLESQSLAEQLQQESGSYGTNVEDNEIASVIKEEEERKKIN